jgi:predicted protein tyrosine phosphatase
MAAVDLHFGLTICGIEELVGHTDRPVTHILSILDPLAPVPDAFVAFASHERLELRFDDIIEETEGKLAPQEDDIRRILAFGAALRADLIRAPHLLIHCHAGISRSTAAMTLILAQAWPDQPATSILGHIQGLREKAWPNLRMMEIGDRLLGRAGTLVQATHALHSRQLVRRPHLAEFMTNLGRAREVRIAIETAPADDAGP